MSRVARTICVSVVAALAGPLAALHAQDATPFADGERAILSISASNAGRPSVQFHHSEHAIWARGRTYKARADAAGFTYLPFLGSRVPRSWPVHFKLTEASVDGRHLPLTAARASRSGQTVTLDHGPVTVRYDLEVESVEQSFTLTGVAGAAAEVVLRVALETDLAVEPEGRGFAFRGPAGGVAFGAAVALDGAGRSLAIDAQIRDGQLVFRVPAHFVAAAEGTLIIDPIITSITIDDFGADLTQPDVAFEQTGNTCCVVYEESFTQADVDIYYRTLDATTLAIVDQGYVDLSTGRSTRPKIAANAQGDTFLVVFDRADGSGRSELFGRLRGSLGGSLWAPEFALTPFDPLYVHVAHDVGGEAYEGVGESNYLVVWEKRDINGGLLPSDIQGRLIAPDGTLAPSTIDITASSTVSDECPAVSRYTGDPNAHAAWWVAYTNEDESAAVCQVRGARIAFDGTVTDPDHVLWEKGDAMDIRNPAVSAAYTNAHDETVHVSFDYELVSGETRSDLLSIGRGGALEVKHAKGIDLVDVSDPGTNPSAAFATLADRAALIYVDRPSPGSPFDILTSTLEFALGGQVAMGERRVVLDHYSMALTVGNQMVSRASGGDRTSRQVFAVWENTNTTFGGVNIFGALLEFPEPTAIGGNVCRGFKNSTGDFSYLTAFGDNTTTAPVTLRATRLPLNTVGYFLAAQLPATNTPPVSEGLLCVSGSIGRYIGAIQSSGPTGRFDFVIDPQSIAQPTGNVSAMAGDTWFFQAWHRDANPTSTSNFTNAVAVDF